MSDLHDLVDPEARALLNEVAQDPRSKILRKDRTMQMAQAVANGEDLWITRKTGLTSAERQLLEVWRDEAAFLLRLAHYEGFRRAGILHSRGMYLVGARRRDRELGEDEIERRLRELQRWFAPATHEFHVIGSILNDFWKHRRKMIWLATASLRLAHSHPGQAYVGDDLLVEGATRSAQAIFTRLTSAALPSQLGGAAYCSLGLINTLNGDHADALSAVRKARLANPKSASAAFSWLMQCVKQGLVEEATQAVRYIDSYWKPEAKAIESWTGALEVQDHDNRMIRTVGITSISKLARIAGPASGKILDSLLAFADEQP